MAILFDGLSTRILSLSATPDSLPGLVAWGEGSSLGADGTSIPSWPNLTGSGLDPAQGTAGNQPTVKANAINGQKAALFTSASSQYLGFAGSALGWFNAVPGTTVVMVVQPVTVVAGAAWMQAAVGTTASARVSLQMQATTYRGVARRLDTDAGAVTDGGAPSAGVPVILGYQVDYANALQRLMVNGAVVATNSTTLTGGSSSATDSTGITIGAQPTPANYVNGYLAAYAMWNVAYSAGQLRPVLARWATLYGITLA